jgi:threonine/homoserine/homoserine lactone efflux protein
MIILGFVLGFMGYLPLGNINLTVVQLSLGDSAKKLWGYILFASFMEFVYCVGCLEGMEVLLGKPDWVIILKWAAVVIFTLLGLLSFFHKEDGQKFRVSGLSRGLFAATINPLQIPFWLVWGVYMIQNKWLHNDLPSIVIFAIITATGTVAILWLYAVGGKKLVEKLKLERKVLDRIVGVLLIGLAVWQLCRLIYPQT